MRKRLGVNIDHIATLRNARGEKHPDPYTVALNVLKAGANSITGWLRSLPVSLLSLIHISEPTRP